MHWVATFALLFTLIAAAADDIKTRTVKKRTYFLMFVVVFFMDGFSLLSSLTGLVICFLPVFITAFISNQDLGGGDIKFSALTGWILGWKYGLIALLSGCIGCIAIVPILRKAGKLQGKSIPLVPFLGAGVMASFLIKIFI